jgi:hypothetical protein
MPDGRYNTLEHTPTRRDPVGIDLFAEEINGVVQTTIYQRYGGGPPGERPDGGRVFARSVGPSEEHHDETVQAWIDGAEEDGLQVRDFRPSSTRRVQGACQLLSGAVGAIRAHTRHGGTTAAWIAETLGGVLTDGEKDVVRSTLAQATAPAPEEEPAEDVPAIDAGSEWADANGPDFTVQSISVDEDGVPQIQIQEHTADGRTLSVTAEDIRRRAAAGEIRRVG